MIRFNYDDVIHRILSKNRWANERELAENLGIAPNTWTAYKKGKRSFGLHDITKICDILGVTEHWLLFGIASAESLPSQLPNQPAPDGELMYKLQQIVQRAHKNHGMHLPAKAIFLQIAELHNELLKMTNDISNQKVVDRLLPLIEEELTARLASAKTAPGTGKHQAS